MADVFGALVPTFVLIALGYGVRAARIASAEQFGMVNRFGYFVLYPAFLFTLVSGANFAGDDALPFLGGVIGGFLMLALGVLALRLIFRGDGPAYTSVFQGSVRWNGFALLAAATALFGPQGQELIGLAFGPLVLTLNIICVTVLARWGAAKATSMRALIDQIIANPLILGCATGILVNLIGVRDLGYVSDALQLLGQAAMPIALMCVGAGLDFGALRASLPRVATASVMRLLLAPALVWGACMLTGASRSPPPSPLASDRRPPPLPVIRSRARWVATRSSWPRSSQRRRCSPSSPCQSRSRWRCISACGAARPVRYG